MDKKIVVLSNLITGVAILVGIVESSQMFFSLLNLFELLVSIFRYLFSGTSVYVEGLLNAGIYFGYATVLSSVVLILIFVSGSLRDINKDN